MSFLYQVSGFPLLEFSITNSTYLNILQLNTRFYIDPDKINSVSEFEDAIYSLVLYDNGKARKFPLDRKRLELSLTYQFAGGICESYHFSKEYCEKETITMKRLINFIKMKKKRGKNVMGKTIIITDSRLQKYGVENPQSEDEIKEDISLEIKEGISLENQEIFKMYNYTPIV